MCDFDITSFREKPTTTSKKKGSGDEESSFDFYLNNFRKGLDDSDSDSDNDNNKKIDSTKKRKWPENDKDNTTASASTSTSAPPSEPIVDNSSTEDTEQVECKQDIEIQVDSKQSTDNQQQPSMQIASQSPILLADDDVVATKRNNTDGVDLTTELPKRQKKQRPSHTASLDIEDLDPELASLFAQDSETTSTNDTPKPEVVPEKIKIKVHYVSLMESTDPKLQSFLEALSKPVKIIMLNNSRFDTMMTQYCKKKMLNLQEMVLVYENSPVVLRATPSSLSMPTDSTNKMEVYKRSDFEKKMATEQEFRAARLAQINETGPGDGDDQDEDDTGYNSPDNEEAPKEDVLRIKLRGKDNKDVGLRVKPTTQIETVIKNYIRHMKLDPGIFDKIQLSFEGETLESSMTIADTDLEDEDMVSVIIH